MEEIQQVRKRVEFRLNKQSLHDVRVEDAEVEDVGAQGTTAVCCLPCAGRAFSGGTAVGVFAAGISA
jgi:hypothetical protein